ncbi:MAG TPA: mycothiol system anti-sigma-R factor [Actinospica sp.]|nr:mycothiol system anti-sigma-R factor [Actinospica sp.]
MSCGHPHDDCASVLEHVYEYIDHEMADDDLATVKQHLDDCTPCLAEYGLEQAVKSLVHRCCSEVAPEDLRAKVLSKIRQVQAGASVDGRCVPEDEPAAAAASAKQTPALS